VAHFFNGVRKSIFTISTTQCTCKVIEYDYNINVSYKSIIAVFSVTYVRTIIKRAFSSLNVYLTVKVFKFH